MIKKPKEWGFPSSFVFAKTVILNHIYFSVNFLPFTTRYREIYEEVECAVPEEYKQLQLAILSDKMMDQIKYIRHDSLKKTVLQVYRILAEHLKHAKGTALI